MSLALIQESAKEVRRLAIAGSPLAVGDFRLKKLIAPLEQSGAKVPVFAQVAKSISDLVNGKEAESAANLLSLSTLLNAILYTQGQTGTTAEFRDLELVNAGLSTTRTPARVLKPIIEALTTTGGGRFEVVKSAFERGAFNDLRLIEPSIRALDDNYPELADLVAEKILPKYGPGIIPLLKRNLELKGKKSDARRLRVIHELDSNGSLELLKTALEQGAPEVRVEAIRGLAKHEECLPLILEQSKAKNKSVREAALRSLAAFDRPEVNKLFIDMIRGKATDMVTEPFRLLKNELVFGLLLKEAAGALEGTINKDSSSVLRFFQLLQCFEKRKDTATEEFLLGCFAQCDKLSKVKSTPTCVVAGSDIIRQLAEMLYAIGSSQSLCALLAQKDKVPSDSFRLILRSAMQVWPAEKVYEEFAPLLEQKKGAGKNKMDEIQQAIWSATRRGSELYYEATEDSSQAEALKKVTWDPRWLDAAIKADHVYIVCSLACPGHKNVISYLAKKLDGKEDYQTDAIFEALSRCEYAGITNLFLQQITKKTKKADQWDYQTHYLLNSARHLPAADLPKLDAFAATLNEKMVDRFLEALEPLRTTIPI